MINFKDTHWVWDRSKGSAGIAFVGTDFNTNVDVRWAREAIPEALAPYFEEIEIGLVPNLNGMAAMTIEGAVVMLDMRWLKAVAESQEWDALKEVLVHERQHVIQMLEGRLLADQAGGYIYWEGVQYTMAYVSAQYPDLPWEDEAYAAQAEWLVAAGHYASKEEALSALYQQIAESKAA